jgi:hypothetical protein
MIGVSQRNLNALTVIFVIFHVYILVAISVFVFVFWSLWRISVLH